MKPTSSIALIAAALTSAASAVEYTVTTCADLADVDDELATALTIGSASISCQEYTRFRVRNNLTLKATVPAVEFSNLSLKVLGDLTVEPDVVFSGVVDQPKNGGVLHVAEGATATFMGTSEFSDNSIYAKYGQDNPNTPSYGYVTTKGGAIHNKGELTFEGDSIFLRNVANVDDSTDQGRGGAISNAKSGNILFKGKLTMEGNRAEGFFEGTGGAIYNRGGFVVNGESHFASNSASDGGAIFNAKVGNMGFNGFATFYSNRAWELEGGAIWNSGGFIDFTLGSLFDENSASGSGDGGAGGAIYNNQGGYVTLTEPTTFSGNVAFWGGAIYNGDGSERGITTFPDNTVFDSNVAEYCPDVHEGGRGVDDASVDKCAAV